jgi:hypothetical protein
VPERPAVVPMAPVFSGCGANGLAGACCCGCGWVGSGGLGSEWGGWHGLAKDAGGLWLGGGCAKYAAGWGRLGAKGGRAKHDDYTRGSIKKVAGVSILLLTGIATDCQL